MQTERTADFDAIGDELARMQKAVPHERFSALHVDRKSDVIRFKADLQKLKKHHFELLCSYDVLQLKTPKKHYRVPLRGFAQQSEFSGTHLIITIRSGLEASGHGHDELGRATSRALHAAKGLKRVFVTRAMNAVADLAEQNPERSLQAATAASSDWVVLVHALSSFSDLAPLSLSDPLAKARLRGIQARRELLQREGGGLAAAEVAELLGISRQAVDKRRKAGTLLAVGVGGRGYHYPAWQFEKGVVVKGLEVVLKELDRHDEWMKLAFFVNPNVRLKNESPLEHLRRGDVEAVLDAAKSYVEHGAA